MPVDHRQLGADLDLFASDDLLGLGMPLWLPAGAAIRSELERFVVDLERRAGYHHVYTPPLAKRSMYERSGHLEHFADGMFPPVELDGEPLLLRPMNCPHHVRVFGACERSYRDLPVRIAELGAMFRNERSGVVAGLSRVRCMTLNDGHVFCHADQVHGELAAAVGLIRHAYDVLGVRVHRWRLSLRGEGGKFADDEDAWQRSEAALRSVLDELGVDYEPVAGEAAFYGPKLDVQVLDAGGREQTLSTVQVDYVLARRFGARFVAPDGSDEPPVMIHRSVVSTMERMVAHLLEVHEGWLPSWLAPVQLAVLPVSDPWHAAADRVVAAALAAGLRAELWDARHTLGARIRRAAQRHVANVAVIGEREAADGTVALRSGRGGRSADARSLPALEAVARLAAEVAARA